MKKVILLGSSGSIGESTCKVARALPEKMKLFGLGVAKSTDRMLEQAQEFGVKALAVSDPHAAEKVKSRLPQGTQFYPGAEGLARMVEETEADMVLVAIVGTAGLAPALAALRSGKDLAVASKEILVLAGSAVMAEAKKRKKQVLPVDSEHNAIDSATMFNKGLEMIEAHWLFGLPMRQVDVVVHPQSIVHSLVEFIDGSVLAQLSVTDMCFPIQYAVTYPERMPSGLPPLDLAKLGTLSFEQPDEKRFPALRLAREAGEQGGTLPGVLNAANEVAVEAFLAERISFPRIWGMVEEVMKKHRTEKEPSLEAIIDADRWARGEAKARLEKQK